MFETDLSLSLLYDIYSPLLSEKKREELFDKIIAESIAYKIVAVDEKTIDEINILNATMLAMKTAIEGLEVPADAALIDGNKCPKLDIFSEYVIGGDAKVKCIAAASILAKVSRDRYMLEKAKEYPQYQFEKHKGYGTATHIKAIKEHGLCPIHRKTFTKNF